MAKSAAEWAMEALIKNLPPEMLEQIAKVGKISVELKAQLDRIEQQNLTIIGILRGNDVVIEHEASQPDPENLAGGNVGGNSGGGTGGAPN